ncbi:hypothetical protein V6N11_007118 [Hibiscus sabdariffa]|uniref:Transmembrane protein n=1 Tax=Hibiscus sabdariffa TaxID=183260 RepID=A0ABR2RT05_9ROSI
MWFLLKYTSESFWVDQEASGLFFFSFLLVFLFSSVALLLIGAAVIVTGAGSTWYQSQQHSSSHNQADDVGHNTPVHQQVDEINETEEGIHVEESGNDLAATLPADIRVNQEVLSANDESGNDLAADLSNQEVLSADDETNTP